MCLFSHIFCVGTWAIFVVVVGHRCAPRACALHAKFVSYMCHRHIECVCFMLFFFSYCAWRRTDAPGKICVSFSPSCVAFLICFVRMIHGQATSLWGCPGTIHKAMWGSHVACVYAISFAKTRVQQVCMHDLPERTCKNMDFACQMLVEDPFFCRPHQENETMSREMVSSFWVMTHFVSCHL